MALTVKEFEKAVATLEESVELYNSEGPGAKKKAFRDACIQRFKYCIELSWKTSMKVLGSQTQAAKPAVREMARSGLISNPEQWFGFLDARNLTSHSYDEDLAQQVFTAIEKFLPEAKALVPRLDGVK